MVKMELWRIKGELLNINVSPNFFNDHLLCSWFGTVIKDKKIIHYQRRYDNGLIVEHSVSFTLLVPIELLATLDIMVIKQYFFNNDLIFWLFQAERYQCSKCEKSFKEERYLKEHVKFKHDKKVHKCQFCSYEHARRQMVLFHMRDKHNFCKCPKCSWVLDMKEEFEQHIKLHETVRKDWCEHCDMAFNDRFAKHYHMNKYHCGIAHTCTHCNMTFTSKWNLSRHLIRHKQQILPFLFFVFHTFFSQYVANCIY